LATLEGHKATVNSLAFSRDGKTLASGSLREPDQPKDGKEAAPYVDEIRLWDVSSRKNTLTLTGKAGMVESVAFSADGKTLAAGRPWRGAAFVRAAPRALFPVKPPWGTCRPVAKRQHSRDTPTRSFL